ncbi:MAG: type IV pilus modification PilV family protein [Rhodanobacteraceae bacterium]
MRRDRRILGFALYEVLLGLTIFVVGVLALGRAVENCINASALSEEDNRVRQLLSNRMAELQATPQRPDSSKEDKIQTGYGMVRLIQKARAAELKNDDDTIVPGITRVTLTAEWSHGGVKQNKQLMFYVYRAG